ITRKYLIIQSNVGYHLHWYQFNDKDLPEDFRRKFRNIMRRLVLPDIVNNVSMEEDVAGCNNVALLDYASRLAHFKVPERRKKTLGQRPFVYGKERIFPGDLGWKFRKSNGNYLLRFLRKIYESGLFTWIENRIIILTEARSGLRSLQESGSEVDELKISSNFMQTMFLLFSWILIVLLIIFAAEIWVNYWYII
ncbi:unnamed protein product, partial [Allacma fusca]